MGEEEEKGNVTSNETERMMEDSEGKMGRKKYWCIIK